MSYHLNDKVIEIWQSEYDELIKVKQELEVLHKAYDLMAKDYCECMGCAFCDYRSECRGACHFKDIDDGKEFLQEYFLKKARKNV